MGWILFSGAQAGLAQGLVNVLLQLQPNTVPFTAESAYHRSSARCWRGRSYNVLSITEGHLDASSRWGYGDAQ